MRIGDLARTTGIAVATIKYYLREGVLHPGQPTAPNQADYDQTHLERLELIRALRDGAGLSIAAIGRTFTALDAHRDRTRPEYLATAVAALSEPLDIADDETDAYTHATAQVDELVDALGWDVDTTSPGRDDLIRALVAIHRYLPDLIHAPRQLRPFAEAVRTLADVEIPDDYDPQSDLASVLRYSVLGTVLFEPLLTSLRKLAHVDRTRHLAARTQGRQLSGGGCDAT